MFAPERYINYKRKDEEKEWCECRQLSFGSSEKRVGYFGMYAVPDSHDILLKPKEVPIVGYAVELNKEESKEHFIHKSEKGTGRLLGFISKRNYSTFNAMQIYLAYRDSRSRGGKRYPQRLSWCEERSKTRFLCC